MSVSQYQNAVNTLDKEICDLEKKKAAKDKDCASIQSKISSVSRSITKNTSASMAASKLKKIEGYRSDYAKRSSESADLEKKIADKRKKRNEAYLKLQKAQQAEQKKQEREATRVQASYEARISSLQQQLISNAESDPPLDEKYDVFVSHAFEDKEEFVDEFVDELRKQNISVWYDSTQLKWGDSMRERIDNGLSKSHFGIVVLSPNYIREGKYWTKAELNGLFQKETVNGKTILPIWHNLTKKQVIEYSPIIADRKAMTTANMTAEEIALELRNLFSYDTSEENV